MQRKVLAGVPVELPLLFDSLRYITHNRETDTVSANNQSLPIPLGEGPLLAKVE